MSRHAWKLGLPLWVACAELPEPASAPEVSSYTTDRRTRTPQEDELRPYDWSWSPPNSGRRGVEADGAQVAWIGDTNGDGYEDAAWGARSFSNLAIGDDIGMTYVFEGGPDGLSDTPTLEIESDAFVAADFNGDGYSDVIALDRSDRTTIYAGSATGLTWTMTEPTPDVRVDELHAADVDGDGTPDLVMIGERPSGVRIPVARFHRGVPGSWPAPEPWTEVVAGIDRGNDAVALGDIDGDDAADFAYIDQFSVTVYSGAAIGLGRLTPVGSIAADAAHPTPATLAYLGDVDGDGIGELGLGQANWALNWLNQGKVEGWQSTGLALEKRWQIQGDAENRFIGLQLVSHPDADGDGDNELVVSGTIQGESELRRLTLWRGGPGGPTRLGAAINAGYGLDSQLGGFGDADGDGTLELLSQAQVRRGAGLTWRAGLCDDDLSHDLDFFGGALRAQIRVGAAGDVNGDGADDVVLAFDEVIFGGETPTRAATRVDQPVLVADLDGDGFDEVVTDDGKLYRGASTPDLDRPWATLPLSGAAYTLDLNGDGVTDLLTRDNTDWHALIGRPGALPAAGAAHQVFALDTDILGVGDLNADGRDDVIATAFTGTEIWLGTAGGRLAGPTRFRMPSRLTVDAVTDTNGDGRADVIAHRDGVVAILESRPGGFSDPIVVFQDARNVFARASVLPDLNGDGREELAVRRSGRHVQETTVHLSREGGFSEEPTWIVRGGDQVIVADVNGDGLRDLITDDRAYTDTFEYEGRVSAALGRETACTFGASVWER